MNSSLRNSICTTALLVFLVHFVFAQCEFSDTCADALDLGVIELQGDTCLLVCNDEALTGSGCGYNNGVWYKFVAGENVFSFLLDFGFTDSNFQGVVNMYEADCGNLVRSCAEGNLLEFNTDPDIEYFIEVMTTNEGSEFELCVIPFNSKVVCAEATLASERTAKVNLNPNGPFCPGELVTFNYDIEFKVDSIGFGNNCQWLHGIIPSLGEGWDKELSNIKIQAPGFGWEWFDQGNVDYNFTSRNFRIEGDTTSEIKMFYDTENYNLSSGDLLPGGWWYVSSGSGGNCLNTGDPDDSWGLPAGCNSVVTVSFTFELIVKTDLRPEDCNIDDLLKVHIFSMADGQTGCWVNASCAGDLPVLNDYMVSCDQLLCEGIGADDQDGDGFTSDEDCDDMNENVFPGNIEICDNIDNNCDGIVDEGFELHQFDFVNCSSNGNSLTFDWEENETIEFYDVYLNGAYLGSTSELSYVIEDLEVSTLYSVTIIAVFGNGCDNLRYEIECATDDEVLPIDNDGDGFDSTEDCDDSDPNNFPGNTEICDGQDNNCNGEVDENLVVPIFFCSNLTSSEILVEWESEAPSFCLIIDGVQTADQTDNSFLLTGLSPDQTVTFELVAKYQAPCFPVVVSLQCATLSIVDLDGDGVFSDEDCDDNDPNNFPGNAEFCDGQDNDCDGEVDEDLNFVSYYEDADGDGFGNPLNVISACEEQEGYVLNAEDCNDMNALINPDAEDIPNNGIDENCDGLDRTDIVKELAGQKVEVFPNPVFDFLSINSSIANLQYQIYNAVGIAVDAGFIGPSKRLKLDLEQGIYYLSLSTFESQSTIVFRIIKL